MNNYRKRILLLVLLISFLSESAFSFTVYEHRFSLGLPILSFTRKTSFSEKSYSVPMGLVGDYAFFISNDLAISANFVLNIGTTATVMMGGSVGLYWFYKGGSRIQHDDLYLQSVSSPNLNIYAFGGLGGRSFDFTAFDKAAELAAGATIKESDPKSVKTGSFIGFLFGVGCEVPFNMFDSSFNLGTRFQFLTSFASEISPDITGTEIWLYTIFKL